MQHAFYINGKPVEVRDIVIFPVGCRNCESTQWAVENPSEPEENWTIGCRDCGEKYPAKERWTRIINQKAN